jgi:hypothetical protein
MKLQFGRRRFLNYLLLTAALVRCKKDPELTTSTKTTPSTPPKTTGSLSPPNIDQYLAEYSITEIGTETMPIDPAWNQTINGYNNQISYNAGDTVDVFLSGRQMLIQVSDYSIHRAMWHLKPQLRLTRKL